MDPVITEQVSREHPAAPHLDDFLAELANAGRLPSHPARPRSSGEEGGRVELGAGRRTRRCPGRYTRCKQDAPQDLPVDRRHWLPGGGSKPPTPRGNRTFETIRP